MNRTISLFALICVLLLVLSPIPSSARPDSDRQATHSEDSPQDLVRFGSLSLKGELKRPELNFDRAKMGFDQDSHQDTPDNFSDDILNDANRLKP